MGKGSEKFWELESKLPRSVKPYTDRVIRAGARFRAGVDREGRAWVERHHPLRGKKKGR